MTAFWGAMTMRAGILRLGAEAEQALAGPVQTYVVRAARLRRLVAPTTNGDEIPLPPIPEGGGRNFDGESRSAGGRGWGNSVFGFNPDTS